MTFKELPVGAEFVFEASELHPTPYTVRGPWVKLSARRYHHVNKPKKVITVGFVGVRVIVKFSVASDERLS